MGSTLTEVQLATYAATLRQRASQDAERRRRRLDAAWRVARDAAELLRSRYGATSVLVFGSLAEGDHFTPHSDIDLAVRGIRPGDHYIALGRLLSLSPDFEFDLVDLDSCAPAFSDAIAAGGVPL